VPSTSLEERIAGLEGSYKELTKRSDDLRSEMHRGFDGLRTELKTDIAQLRGEVQGDNAQQRAEMADLCTEIRTNHRWAMRLILMNWLSILAAIFLVMGRR
jgi:chromosome segregation ATPase